MEAVEYYAAYESDKYTYFQDKLTKLLSNQKVHDHLESSPVKERKPPEPSPQSEPQSGLKTTAFNYRKQMELNMIMGEKKAQDMTKELLKNYGSSRSELNKLVQQNLKHQETDIAKRLEQRKQLARSNSQRNLTMRNTLVPSLTVELGDSPNRLGVPLVDPKDLRPSTPRAPTSNDDPYGFAQVTAQSNKSKHTEEIGDSEGLAASKAALLDAAASLEPLMKPASASTGGKKKASFLDKLKKSAKPQEEAAQQLASPGIKPFTPAETDAAATPAIIAEPVSDAKVSTSEAGLSSLNSSPTLSKVSSPSPLKTTGNKKKKAKIIIELDTQEEIDALRQELEVLEMQFAEETDESRQSELEGEILRINIEIDNKMQEATQKAEAAAKAAEEATNPSTSEFDMEAGLVANSDSNLDEKSNADTIGQSQEAPKKKGGALGAMMSKLKSKSKQTD